MSPVWNERKRHEQLDGDGLATQDGRLVLPVAKRFHGRQCQYRVSGHSPHFHYVSLGVDHRVNYNRTADSGLSVQHRGHRLGPPAQSPPLHPSPPALPPPLSPTPSPPTSR